MLKKRITVVVLLAAAWLAAGVLILAAPAPLQAQCAPGAEECRDTAPPLECPPGSHPSKYRDCIVDQPAPGGQQLGASGQQEVTIQATLNFTGAQLDIAGNLQDTDPNFDRRSQGDAQICNGDSAFDNTNYNAFSIINASDEVHTVDIEMIRTGGTLDPYVFIYANSFDPANPANNCLKADNDSAGVPDSRIRRFTWKPGHQLIIVATGVQNGLGKDTGTYTLKIIPRGQEYEPNDDAANARPISPNIDWVTAEISPTGDVDYYLFEAKQNQRVWAYVRTDQSTTSTNSELKLLNSNETVTVESDDDDGGQDGDSSSIAGVRIPADGTYLLRVNEKDNNSTISTYYLYVYLSDQTPTTENETNDSTGTANPYDTDGGATYQNAPQLFEGFQDGQDGGDFFKFIAPQESVIFTSLDTDPDDDNRDFDGTLTLYDAAGAQMVVANSGASLPRSEALSYGQVSTGSITGTIWYASVISNTGSTLNLQYRLLAGYSPITQGDVTYSTDVDKTIPTSGTITSTLISGNYCLNDLDVWLDIDHENLDDLSVSLKGPDSTEVELFSNRGGDDDSLLITLDDNGGLLPLPDDGVDAANAAIGGRYQTEDSTLSNFINKSGIGVWTLTITDDTTGNTGTLNNWAVIMHCTPLNEVYLPIIFKESS